MTHEDRILLEQSIIAEILSDPNAFIVVADILSYKNFTDKKFSKIYETCSQIYPSVINIVSISANSQISILELFDILERVYSRHNIACNLRYNAMLLLELSIKEEFFKLIKGMLEDNIIQAKEEDFRGIYNELLNPNVDVFLYVKIVLDYFKTSDLYTEEYEKVKEFDENIVNRFSKIKEQVHIHNLFFNLENIYQFDYRKKELLQALSNITKYVMANEVDSNYKTKLLNLSILK
jgi:replicative DNA helicase